MVRAALLDRRSYREIAEDSRATGQAFVVVVLVAVSTGIGVLDFESISAGEVLSGLRGLPSGIVLGSVGWVVWATVTYLIGRSALGRGKAAVAWSRVARGVGFAQAPGIIRALGALPNLGLLIPVVAIVWILAAMVLAVSEAFHLESFRRSGLVVLAGFLPYLAILTALYFLVAAA